MPEPGHQSVYHLGKLLTGCASVEVPPGILLRPFEESTDIADWLRLREVAFAASRPGVGKWTEHDFAREMTGKSWWRPDYTWLAVEGKQRESMVGTVTSIVRIRKGGLVADVHWLMVHPAWRGRGIGQCLVAQLEQAMWREGVARVRVETHRGWEAAVRLYERLGYRVRL